MDIEALRAAATDVVEGILTHDDTLALLPDHLVRSVPSKEEVLKVLESFEHDRSNDQALHEDILMAEFYFRDVQAIQPLLPSGDAIVCLQSRMAQLLLPSETFAEQSLLTQGEDTNMNSQERTRLRAFYASGIRLLSHLRRCTNISDYKATPELVTCLSSFTHAEDPWTNQASRSEASELLVHYTKTLASEPGRLRTLVSKLLRENVRPAFAKSKNSAITPAGRRAISALPPKFEASIDETKLKPWKYGQNYIVAVFEWILQQLDASSIESNWPLLIPPLLAMLDDASTTYKIRGCAILTIFLKKVRPKLLGRTGLGEVFQEALTPCLLYLPELTPEPESLRLLTVVYPTILSLVRTRFADAKDQRSKQKALDHIFRFGILKGYAQAGENVRIAEFLMRSMTNMVNEMGVASSRHLKHILPLLSGILVSPFATAYPPLLIAALHGVQSVMINDWPRIPYHRGEIMKGLVVCWCKVLEEDSPERSSRLEQVQRELEHSVELLSVMLKRDCIDLAAEYRSLAASDGRLERLLAI